MIRVTAYAKDGYMYHLLGLTLKCYILLFRKGRQHVHTESYFLQPDSLFLPLGFCDVRGPLKGTVRL